jgi:hypothetical protein
MLSPPRGSCDGDHFGNRSGVTTMLTHGVHAIIASLSRTVQVVISQSCPAFFCVPCMALHGAFLQGLPGQDPVLQDV